VNTSLIGQKFNRLTVIKLLGKKSGHNNYLCQCDCGNFTEAAPTNFKSGKIKSCGCLRKEGSNLKHGLKGHYLYSLWSSIKSRCYIKSATGYKNYGGKNIIMFQEWKNDFKLFYDWIIENLGERPSKAYSLDRINNLKNYEPGNLRWATQSEQSQNSTIAKIDAQKVKTVYDLYFIDNKPIQEIAKKVSCSYNIVYDIINGRTWNNITNLLCTREK
jgi:hypothetical protein